MDAAARTALVITRLAQALGGVRTRQEALGAALNGLVSAFQAAGGVGVLADREEIISSGPVAAQVGRDGIDDLARQALSRGDVLIVAPADATPGGGTSAATSVAAALAVPLRLNGAVLGALALWFTPPREITAVDRALLDALAAQAALGLDRVAGLERAAGLEEAGQVSRAGAQRAAALETERAFLTSTLDSLGEAVIVCDAQGRLVRFAGQAGDMHGQEARPVPPEQWAAQYHLCRADGSGPLELAEIPLYRAWQGETVRDAEMAICVPGQPIRYVLASGQPVRLPDGRVGGAVVAQRDVTAARLQAQALTDYAARLEQQEAALHDEQAASRAFERFSEAASHAQSIEALGEVAMTTLHGALPGISAMFSEERGGRWWPVTWTPDLSPALLETLQRGVPSDTPIVAQALAARAPVFLDGWQEQEQRVAHSAQYHTAAMYPVMQDGEPRALLSLGFTIPAPWTDVQRKLVVSLGRSFTLLYSRIVAARELQAQRDEAEKRTQALEAFAELSRDLASETDRYVLVRGAQEIMLSLLTPGYALYWEEGPDRWVLKSQVGDIGNPELQRLVDEYGLPLDAPALHGTWQTGRPNYQDNYAQGTDTPLEMIRHVNAATAFRVTRRGQPLGMLAIGLFDQRFWTPMDRAVLETAIHNLILMLERAQSVEELALTNAELQIANSELQAFTYSVSHDLRTPVRHVKGFTELAMAAARRGQLDKTQQHLEIVSQAADRMTDMIDSMLALSRAGRVDMNFRPVPLEDLVRQAQEDVRLEFPQQRVEWRVAPLPVVRADAGTLQQVITNLFSNAVKFARPGWPLQVRVWAEERPQDWAVFVEDTGSGFDQQYVGKLFGVFQRLHTQDQFAGTGVGLATIKRIVSRHGGQVWAHGQLDEGATFAFSLPKGP